MDTLMKITTYLYGDRNLFVTLWGQKAGTHKANHYILALSLGI